MEIFEKRQGPEPSDMPFNGVDFYLHELCDGSLNAIQRMLKGGHKALALQTATETQGIVEGMKDILLELGQDADPEFARAAWEHLARYYHCLHPKAQHCAAIQPYPQWAPGVDAFVIRQGSEDSFRDLMVIYPESEQSPIDDNKAWELIDRSLPPALRGEASQNSLDPSVVGPVRLGSKLYYEFASGAMVTLESFADRRGWTRLEIIGRGLQGRWDPRTKSAA